MPSEIEGLRELDRKLQSLGRKMSQRVMRRSLTKATRPVLDQMRGAIPVSTGSGHKTYRGRVVAPGFAKRSLVRRTRRTRGGTSSVLGLRGEAFYAINFLDQGPHHITKRGNRRIKPYTLRRRPWFEDVFIRNRSVMENTFVNELRREIRSVTGGN